MSDPYVPAPHLGAVTGYSTLKTVTPVIDTSAYATGDLLFDATEIPNIARVSDGFITVHTVTVIDKDDEGASIEIFFTNDATTWGSLGSAPTQADAVSDGVQGDPVAISTYYDIGGAKIGGASNIGKLVQCTGHSIYIAGIVRATVTYTAATDLVIKVGAYID